MAVGTRQTRLRTVGNIKTELGKVYRRADAGLMDWQDACAASRILRELRQLIEGTDLETRIAALEAVVAERDGRPPPRRNGHDHHARRA